MAKRNKKNIDIKEKNIDEKVSQNVVESVETIPETPEKEVENVIKIQEAKRIETPVKVSTLKRVIY